MSIRFLVLLAIVPLALNAQKKVVILPISQQSDGSFVYVPDGRGNRIPDYSYCGYQASEEVIPMVAVKAFVPCRGGDARADIQAALDYVSSLKPDADGFRGAVLLDTGRYEVSGSLWIKASGVVLRGSGAMRQGTEIVATALDKTTLIRFKGLDDRQKETPMPVSDVILPVGSLSVNVSGHSFRAGDKILIQPTPQKLYFKDLRPGNNVKEIDSPLSWERSILAVKGNTLTLDVPLTYEFSTETGGAQVRKMRWPGRLEKCGLENLRLTSVYDQSNLKDENHAWIAVSMENVRDAWVRRVEFRHFAGSAVFVAETASRVTIEDCKSLAPVSEIGGQRRYSFYIKGAQCLCQRIQAEYGYHDFAVGAYAAGPNAFVQCWSILPYSYSGTIASFSTGVLFDICSVDGEALRFDQPNKANALSGWSTCNSMFWNSTASIISCSKPDNGQNWAFGAWGQFNGRGYWSGANNHASPWSLYYAQLTARTKKENINRDKLIALSRGGMSSIEDARKQIEAARQPLMMLSDWIDTLSLREPIDIVCPQDVYIPAVETPATAKNVSPTEGLVLQNGLLLRDGGILTGSRHNPDWWRGSMNVSAASSPHIVRYALGPEGYGVVDDLDAMTDAMLRRGTLVTDFNYALWYDRRRDDHQRTSRIDGDVQPPLYELPFARSGEGRAWDGLSRYDLTKWNNWYWNRLKQYADLADEKSLVLFYQQYFQHNIIEAGAHWADFPWRSANNVNETGFPEPTPYAGNKRVFMSEHFYDETHLVRRELHRQYIRKCLDNFADNGSVIHFISDEFTGPLHFTQFWLDVIAEWQAETGKDAMVALSTPKDVQDSILQDPVRAALIDVIDIRYWYINASGKVFAPQGGLNLAPRQFERIESPGTTLGAQVYGMVRDMRRAYPDKAVIYSADSNSEYGWAAFMAGASLCVLPAGLPDAFKLCAAQLQPIEAKCWTLASNTAYMVYPDQNNQVQLDLSSQEGLFKAQYIDLKTGKPVGKIFQIKAGTVYTDKMPKGLLWLYK